MARKRRDAPGAAQARPDGLNADRAGDLPWAADGDELRIVARVTPRGGCDALDGVGRDAEGRPALALRVSAPPDGGRANAAVEALVAGLLDLPRSAVRVERGATARIKRLRAEGPPEALAARLAEAVARAAKP